MNVFGKVFVVLGFMALYLPELFCQTMEQDTSRVSEILALCDSIEFAEPLRALELYQKAIDLSLKHDHYEGAFKATLFSGFIHNNMAHYDTAHIYFDEAQALSIKTGELYDQGLVHLNRANTFMFQGDLDLALESHYAGINILEELNDEEKLVGAYANVSSVFGQMDNYSKQIEYLEKSLKITPKDNYFDLALTYGDLGLTHMNKNEASISYEYFLKADSASKYTESPMVKFFVVRNWGDYYDYLDSSSIAIEYYEISLQMAKDYNFKYYEKDLILGLGECNLELGNLVEAEKFLDEALEVGRELNVIELPKKALKLLSELHKTKGDYKKAFECLQEENILKDSLISEIHLKSIEELETKYEIVKRDKELIQQKLELERATAKNKTMSILTISLLAGAILLWGFFLQRHKLGKQQLVSEKMDKEVKTLEALIEGEENERNRMAQDLHDGINGDLSVIKYKITSIDKEKLDGEELEEYSSAVNMLDNAIEQVRSISHDLAPPSLQNYNLIEAISQYCMNISSGSSLKINFQSFGEGVDLSDEKETAIYRIAQELINNSVKHSKAKSMLVQLNYHRTNLHLSIEDDGVGFDTNNRVSGLGLNTLQSRAQFLDAELSIESSSAGTSATLDYNFKPPIHD